MINMKKKIKYNQPLDNPVVEDELVGCQSKPL